MRRLPPERHNFIKGAVILTSATMLVKVIGMLYKVPLGNILGASGLSYFATAYSIFTPLYALSVSGLSVAVSRLVAEAYTRRCFREVRKIRRVSLFLFFLIGMAGMATLLFGAGFFSDLVGNRGAAMSVAAVAPAILFCGLMASYRGYYQGLGNMSPTALSQVIESVAKLACGILLSLYIISRAGEEFALYSTVFGRYAYSAEHAHSLMLPWAAAGAVLGVTISTGVGVLVLMLRRLFGDGITKRELARSPKARSSAAIAKSILKLALPVCLASAFGFLASLIDLITIMNRTAVALQINTGAMFSLLYGKIPASITPERLPSYLFGAFSYTSTFFNLAPAITTTIGISALPSMSARWTLGDKRAVAAQASSVIKLAGLIAIPAGLGIAALSGPILELFFPNVSGEIAIAAPLLSMMGIASVLLGITAPVASIFHAVERADIPLKLIMCGAALKFVVNWNLLANPNVGIYAAPLGTILCYLVVLVGQGIFLSKVVGKEIKITSILTKPLICGILCAVAANTSYKILSRVSESRMMVLFSVLIGGIVYGIFVLCMKIITKNEVKLLPNGKKISKILEKLAFLG